jgi:hypothetical protein
MNCSHVEDDHRIDVENALLLKPYPALNFYLQSFSRAFHRYSMLLLGHQYEIQWCREIM